MDELLFYTVDAKYIKYLSEFETHVSYNKNEIGHSRPYLGIVIKVKDYDSLKMTFHHYTKTVMKRHFCLTGTL